MQPEEKNPDELQAWNNGVRAAQSAIPQLVAIANRMPGYQARFWDAFISGISGAAAAQIGFIPLRAIFLIAQEVLDKTEADVRKATTTHH